MAFFIPYLRNTGLTRIEICLALFTCLLIVRSRNPIPEYL